MKKKYGIYWLLAVTALIMMPLLTAAAGRTVYLPIIGKAEGGATTYKIGDRGPAGGFVFFIQNDGQHGLEAAPYDQSTELRWYNGNHTNTEAHGDGVGAGEMNTTLIIANQGSDSNSYAAGLCANLVIYRERVPYGDWYLPSKWELDLMYRNLHIEGMGGFASSFYWSSSEDDAVWAWFQTFAYGIQDIDGKQNAYRVRAIRAF